MEEVEITIIGAGVVGLAIAAELAGNREVYVLEKNETFGQETSSRNSEVIHAGIYYPPGSLKARLCVAGNTMLYELGERCGIGNRKLGKLIVATEEQEISDLEGLLENGKKNGVNLEFLSGQEVKKLEPAVIALAAIFSPSTGIIDSYGLMRYFAGVAKDNGATIVYRARVVGIEKLADKYKITIEDTSGESSFLSTILINSAGLHSDQVAELAGIDIAKAGYKLHYCKGEYFSLNQRLTRKLIYPAPKRDERGLGIHITPDLDGRIRLGPNAHYVDEIDYKVDESQKQDFYDSASKFLPSIEYDELEPDFAGIRPKLQAAGDDFRDFVIRHEYNKGLEGLINLIGIESPGLTASPAIARYVRNMVGEIL
ncbi:NAD(P)/FAD-dependent oxidoreductase [Chloroflexota bacterium]